ncbi:hypothetical protein [Deinococcus sp. UYEF24]
MLGLLLLVLASVGAAALLSLGLYLVILNFFLNLLGAGDKAGDHLFFMLLLCVALALIAGVLLVFAGLYRAFFRRKPFSRKTSEVPAAALPSTEDLSQEQKHAEEK